VQSEDGPFEVFAEVFDLLPHRIRFDSKHFPGAVEDHAGILVQRGTPAGSRFRLYVAREIRAAAGEAQRRRCSSRRYWITL
jgi:hypothetical protein